MVKVPYYDPSRPPDSGRNYVYVVKLGAFFLEEMAGNDVFGRFMQLGTDGQPCDEGQESWLNGIVLLE
ncbi:MAG: hypothetical protein QUU85_04090 [Candidatus Eisenbacteria bacterium]|nr:hypothetical protein [Candidatus Eisenbacteria bacterium]